MADQPGVLAQVAEILGLQGVSVKSVRAEGDWATDARLAMVVHPVLESKLPCGAVELIGRLDFLRARAARDPRDRGDVQPRR